MASPLPSHPTGSSPSWRWLRKVAVLLSGGTVLLIGLAMIVLPGPAVVVIPAGLAILATEFPWARRLLVRAHRQVRAAAQRLRRSQSGPTGAPPRE